MAHSPEEQQYLLARQRICDGELPFLKAAFENDGWCKIFDNCETYLLMACYYRQSSVIEFLASKASENINQPEVQSWLKVCAPNENNALHNYVCSSALAYRRKPRHHGLPILTSILRLLLSLGFDVNEANSYGETPLYLAVTSNDLIAVDILLELGADVNAKCCVVQETVLHQACVSDVHEMMEAFLIVPSIDVNALNMHGWSPLHLAAQKGDTHKVKRLLERGACVDIKSVRGDTPIFFSLQNSQSNNSAFSVLFDFIRKTNEEKYANAQFQHINKRGETLLDCAVKNEHFTGLKTLVEERLFDITHKDAQGKSLLHMSVCHAPNKEIISYLFDNGLSPNEVDDAGNSALMYFFKQSKVAPHKPGVSNNIPNVNV